MAKLLKTLFAIALLGAMFAAGYAVRATRHPVSPPARRILYWVDPMHPQYTSDKPGIAPDCGMTLEPVYADDVNPIAHEGAHTDTHVPPGAIQIPPERLQLIGVKYATAELGRTSRTIRAFGKIAVDETRIGHVHTRIDGWIDKVFVDFTGDIVTQGQPMLTIYSPEMLASQEELLLAARAREVMPSLYDAALRRLQLWDLSNDQIQDVLRTSQPIRNITVHAPMSGVVTERKAFPNQKVTPDSDLYTISDLTHIWIVADVFESDIAAIKVGDAAAVTFTNVGAPPLATRITYIQPQVDPTTRTLKVRLDADNPGMRMKPEMYVNVEFAVTGPQQLTVPVDAVLDSGERQTVFVDLGNGYLQPRQVVVSERTGDRATIASGLTPGERVVSSGTFLIDSETQLKSPGARVSHEGHGHD
jgi:multidrug efflux pump subunit AcrA (membrane-fusion protein)